MRMQRFVLRPLTAFGSPLTGDTLFGQFCWALRRACGEARLNELLEGYCDNRPFIVFSDAFPHGFAPLPTVPSFLRNDTDEGDRKHWKSKRWIALDHLGKDLAEWWPNACDDDHAYRKACADPEAEQCRPCARMQPHNTINRLTGTTGKGSFAPYVRPQIWHHPETALDLYALVDADRLPPSEVRDLLIALGKSGYGSDASAGLGKFDIQENAPDWSRSTARSFMTLAPCAPQGLGYDGTHSYYQIKTHFGRHGDMAALSQPFKHPILLAKTGAVFSLPAARAALFLGQGIGNTSRAQPRAVHQGYAPVVPLVGLRREA